MWFYLLKISGYRTCLFCSHSLTECYKNSDPAPRIRRRVNRLCEVTVALFVHCSGNNTQAKWSAPDHKSLLISDWQGLKRFTISSIEIRAVWERIDHDRCICMVVSQVTCSRGRFHVHHVGTMLVDSRHSHTSISAWKRLFVAQTWHTIWNTSCWDHVASNSARVKIVNWMSGFSHCSMFDVMQVCIRLLQIQFYWLLKLQQVNQAFYP